MTNITHLRTLCLAICLLLTNTLRAQMSDHRFARLFNQAFEEVMAGHHAAARSSLEELHRARPEHAHVSYLLGLTMVKQEDVSERTVTLLRKASQHFDPAHRQGSPEETNAPGTVFLMMGEALAELGKHEDAIRAYRTYMTTISLASIQRKSEVIERIRQSREAMAAGSHRGQQLLAELTRNSR